MFGKLTNFKYKRKGWEPVGFYLAYLLLIILITTLANGLAGSVSPPDSFYAYINVGKIIAVVTCLVLAYIIVQKKKWGNNFGNIMMIVLSGILALWGGGLLGLLIPAYLTSKK